MSFLTVRHLTVYRYSKPVELGEHRMMFRPRESHDLRLLKSNLQITPQPARVRWLHDAFDNSVAAVTFDRATSELRFETEVSLEHFETTVPEYPLEEYAKSYPFSYSLEERANLALALHNHYPRDGVREWLRQFEEHTETMCLLKAVTGSIRRDFAYTRRVEKGVQSPEVTLRTRKGSCRDFAVLMMEATRALGLAARFVSGYIYVPSMDSGKTQGGGATHAWMQVYLPGAGWIDFDPTNSIIGNRNLIRVAVAWDSKQVLPLWGTYAGEASTFLGMDVTVRVSLEAQEV